MYSVIVYKEKVITGNSGALTGTLKIDVNNAGDIAILDKVHTLIGDGEISQFSNVLIQFDLLNGESNGVLEYTTYQAQVSLSVSDLGGAAEDESEFSFEMQLIGKATEVHQHKSFKVGGQNLYFLFLKERRNNNE